MNVSMEKTMSRLADALFTATQQRVLGLLYGRPEESFYMRQILRATGMGVATIKRELDRMVSAEILTLTKIGNQHHYRANPECPLYEELASIVRKTVGIADVIRSVLEPVKSSILVAFIYGSTAKGSGRAKSDIDLMLISDDLTYADVLDLLIPVEKKLRRPINPAIYSKQEFKRKMEEKDGFVVRVMKREKIMLLGSEDAIGDLGKSGKSRSGGRAE